MLVISMFLLRLSVRAQIRAGRTAIRDYFDASATLDKDSDDRCVFMCVFVCARGVSWDDFQFAPVQTPRLLPCL
jgi:hypothetical protein